MVQLGRPTVEVVLTGEERETLERWARRAKSSQALALRCRIVLACAEGATNLEVAARLGAGAGVERRERLVEQQEAWIGRERPGQGDPLGLAARQGRRLAGLRGYTTSRVLGRRGRSATPTSSE